MTTAALEKRVRALEAQMKVLKSAVRKAAPAAVPVRVLVTKPAKAKKLSLGLQQALREVAEGKLSGPFETVDELMVHLKQ